MMDIKINIDKVYNFISKEEILKLKNNTLSNIKALCNATGKGNDFLGWVNLPTEINDDLLNDIQNVANSFKAKTDIVVVVGIGGSYLGAKAVNDALANNFDLMLDSGNPKVIYAGQNISEDYLYELQQLLRNKSFGIVVISKSGTTTEPAIAFRVLKELAEQKYGKEEARERIVAITDENKGALRELSEQEGYKTFVIPDNVGGRYSVLTPVGLLPIAIAGYDIIELVKGAKKMQKVCTADEFENNPAALYAATRNLLYNNGKTLEILANYNPKLHYFAEWWKQLYGESEGKEGKGIFPASVDLTSDLHSMGQYIQEGQRNIFETVLSVKNTNYNLTIPNDQNNLDKLNYLAGKHVDFVNKMAELGTQIAHIDGGVPNIKIEIEKLDEYNIGQLIYFFEIACGISGYLLNVNPFDQPGVEAYKSNMFALLEKPGFEKQSEEIKKRLG